MLSYAFMSLHQSDDDRIVAEEFDNIHNLFAAILSKGIGRQLKQGLYRTYLDRNEDLSLVRGKILLPGTIKNKIVKKQRFSCEFDELSENNPLNQILKTVVMILLRTRDVDVCYKNELKKEMLFFQAVDEINPFSIKWSSIHFQRNNLSYRMLLSICELIIEGMLLTTDDGGYQLASFIDDQYMSRLFEKFILEYYIREHPGLKVSSAQIHWALDDDMSTLLPTMQSDIMLESKSGDTDIVLIIDAKFYTHTLTRNQFDSRTIHSANLYQIFTYVKNKDATMSGFSHQVSGMLLYARTDEDLQPDSIFHISGNKISVRTLDLNKEFSEIARQLDNIASEHFGNSVHREWRKLCLGQ